MTIIGQGIIVIGFLSSLLGLMWLVTLYQKERFPMLNKAIDFCLTGFIWIVALWYLLVFLQKAFEWGFILLVIASQALFDHSGFLFWPTLIIAVLILHAKNEIVKAIRECK
jgi:hypothetical protein